jgi:hypothetical protein
LERLPALGMERVSQVKDTVMIRRATACHYSLGAASRSWLGLEGLSHSWFWSWSVSSSWRQFQGRRGHTSQSWPRCQYNSNQDSETMAASVPQLP